MKNEMGFEDEIMNLFKLKLYNWNINNAIKYHKNDKFCLDYCIDKDDTKYGCQKGTKFLFGCSYQHSINLLDLCCSSQNQRITKEFNYYVYI